MVILGLLALAAVSCWDGDATTSTTSTTPATTSTLVGPGTTCAPRVDVIVFLNPAVSADAIGRAEESLRSIDGVASLVLVSQQEAYEEFQRLFADNPDLVATVQPEALPPSFRLVLDDPAAAETVRSRAETLDGVGQVVEPDAPDAGAVC
jgi:cell division protein FtsX